MSNERRDPRAFSAEDIKKIQTRAIKLAKSKGCSQEHAEDFAQSTLERYLEGKSSHQLLEHSLYDYLRKNLGDKRLLNSRRFNCYAHREIPISGSTEDDAGAFTIPEEHLGGDEDALERNRSSRERIEQCLKLITKPINRATFILYAKWGLSLDEIGHCFGVSESRISQRLSGIQAGLSKALEKDECGNFASKAKNLHDRTPQGPCVQGSSISEMENLLHEKGQVLELSKIGSVAEEESREMASFDEESFSEWLT